MSSFNRRLFLLSAAALPVVGCGFAPAYGPGGAATRLQNSILADEPRTGPDYVLVRQLEDRLGRGAPARYGLSYAVTLSEELIAINPQNITTRYNLLGTVTFALRDLASGAVLTSGEVESFTGYSASGTTVATSAARRDATSRLMTILADQMVARLTAASGSLPV